MEETRKISRQFFPVGVKIDKGYVKQLHGLESQAWDEATLKKIILDLQRQRADAKTWGKQELESRIVQEMKRYGVAISTMMALKTQFRENSSPVFAARLWMAVYGYFDENPRWEQAMESDYLKMNCLAYDDWVGGDKGPPKGCVARLFSECKKEIIKAINRYGDGSHSGRIRMKRTKEEVLLHGK